MDKLQITLPTQLLCTGTCGQDPIWCLWLPFPLFFNIDFFFFMYTTFCNRLCITVWHLYNKNNQTVVSIHTGFWPVYKLYLYICRKNFLSIPGSDIKKYVRNAVWIETTVWLFLLYIHRKLQNVVYMKKKSTLKKNGGWAIRGTIGSCPQVPVLLWCSVKSKITCVTVMKTVLM